MYTAVATAGLSDLRNFFASASMSVVACSDAKCTSNFRGCCGAVEPFPSRRQPRWERFGLNEKFSSQRVKNARSSEIVVDFGIPVPTILLFLLETSANVSCTHYHISGCRRIFGCSIIVNLLLQFCHY